MAIRNKAVEGFFKNYQKEEVKKVEEESLYRQFKRFEAELNALFDGQNSFAIVLEEHISFTRLKKGLVQLASQIFANSTYLETIQKKRLDERLWILIQKELKKAKAEKRNKPSLSQKYVENITKNKECVAGVVKAAWTALEPLKEPHIHENFVRKLFGKLFLMLGGILKKKSKTDKSVLSEVKELYMRSNKVYSFSAGCQELLASNL